MTGCKSLLMDYQEKDGPIVTYGDNSRGYTKGFGTLSNGNVTFTNVAHVVGLKHNLISISQLTNKRKIVQFRRKFGTIFDKTGKALLTAKCHENMYQIDMNTAVTTTDTCFYSQSADNLKWLWHKKLSHLNFKDIHKLSSRRLVSGLTSMSYVKDRLCPGCEKGKHH